MIPTRIKSVIKATLKRCGMVQAPPTKSPSEIYGRVTFSQEGEDVLLWRILDGQHSAEGTYVEVGSNHPWRCSNTAFFYKKGWTGVAIDPNPDFTLPFAVERPKDVFVNLGISDIAGELSYFRFPESLYNTFSPAKANELVNKGIMPAPEVIKVPVMPLCDALAKIWPSGKSLDLLSIDAEGFDERIIKSHDFEKYPVRFLLAEFDSTILSFATSESIVGLLLERKFILVSKLWKTGLFMHESVIKTLKT